MDIEKDSNREAFESWFESRYDAHFMQFALDFDMYADKRTQTCWEAWQAAKAIPDGFVLVPEVLTHEQAARISDDENFFETYQTILAESDTSEDSAVILIQTAHKAMIEAQEPANESE